MCQHCLIEKLRRSQTFIAILIALIISPFLISLLYAPSIGWYCNHNPKVTSMMHYRKSQTGYTYVPLSQISPSLIEAIVFIEDDGFYTNPGIDLEAFRYSLMVNNKKHRFALGGSTITMQLCKNLFLSPKKTFFRKYIEIALALRMHQALSKKRILEIYLNVIEWGPNIWGIENAAQHYYHKSACDLSPEESTILAAIIVRPLTYDPTKANPFYDERKTLIHLRLDQDAMYGPPIRRL